MSMKKIELDKNFSSQILKSKSQTQTMTKVNFNKTKDVNEHTKKLILESMPRGQLLMHDLILGKPELVKKRFTSTSNDPA